MNLKLESFGLFQNQSFPLQNVTVFYGPNETGKTTLFDAIVSSLIRIKGNSPYVRKLKDRYGDIRKADLAQVPLDISPGKFLNSYAIREGKVTLDEESKESAELLNSIQKSLFDSGYNIRNLIEICQNRYSTKKSLTSGKELNKAKESYEEKLGLWEQAEEERIRTLALWADLPAKEREKKELGESLKRKENSILILKKQAEDLQAKQKHTNALHLLQSVLTWESQKVSVEEMKKWISSDKDKTVLKIDEEIKNLRLEQKDNLRKSQEISERLSVFQKEMGDHTLHKNKLSSYEGIAFDIQKKLGNIGFENAPKIEKVEWKKQILFAGISLLASGFGLSLITYLKSYSSLLYVFAGLLSFTGLTLIVNFSRKLTIEVDSSKLDKEFQALAEELTLRTDGFLRPLISSKEGIGDAISKFKESLASASRNLEQANERFQQNQELLARLRSEELKIGNELALKEKEYQEILISFGVKDLQAFQEKISNAKAEEQSFQHLHSQIQTALVDYQLKDTSALKIKLKDDLATFQKNSVPSDFSTEDKSKLKNLMIQMESETNEYHKLKEIYFAKESELSGLVGGSQVKIKDILEKCDRLRKEMEDAQFHLVQIEKNFTAYKALADIFSEMEAGSENQILSLVHSLSKRWNEILPAESIKKIEWNELGEMPKVYDKANVMRDVDMLSTGTKELFYFSLRLEYALRMSEEDHIKWLLLDEPFRHMDPTRMNSAVRYTLDFLRKEKWHAVFFTFDAILKDEIVKNAKEMELDCILHPLG